MSKDFTATITNPERAKEFRSIFATDTVCIESFIPVLATLPGLGERRVYKLDMKLLNENERYRLVQHIAGKFDLYPDEVDRLLDERGVPILAEDCVVTIANPQRWVD